MDKLVLFDIDETLINGFQGHRKAFSQGFKEVYGVDTNVTAINCQGMTEQQVIIAVLKENGLSEKEIKPKIKECMRVMVDHFYKVIATDKIILLDGVQKLLEELNNFNILMGLVTGNLEPIGRGKLKKVNINHYFKIGGFGNDDIDRADLARLAIKRAKKNLGFKFNNNVFLCGDAPQDMKAGKEVGAKTIGVTTGVYSRQQLKDAGAHFVIENFKNTEKVLKIIRG